MQDKPYKYHVFFCTNKRANGESACGDHNSEVMRAYAKKICREQKLSDVRINQAGCLGRCDLGPVLVIYPQNVWYTFIDKEDIDEIVEQHLKNNKIVNRLLI